MAGAVNYSNLILYMLKFSSLQAFNDTRSLVKLLERQLVTLHYSSAPVLVPECAFDEVGHFLVVLVELVLQPQHSTPLTDALSTQRRACVCSRRRRGKKEPKKQKHTFKM